MFLSHWNKSQTFGYLRNRDHNSSNFVPVLPSLFQRRGFPTHQAHTVSEARSVLYLGTLYRHTTLQPLSFCKACSDVSSFLSFGCNVILV